MLDCKTARLRSELAQSQPTTLIIFPMRRLMWQANRYSGKYFANDSILSIFFEINGKLSRKKENNAAMTLFQCFRASGTDTSYHLAQLHLSPSKRWLTPKPRTIEPTLHHMGQKKAPITSLTLTCFSFYFAFPYVLSFFFLK